MIDLLFPACAVLLGYVVLGITGFGSALVVVPLLAWRWPLPEVVALTLLLDVMASLLLGGLNLRQVDFAELRRLLPGMVAGALAGLWLSRSLDASWPCWCWGCTWRRWAPRRCGRGRRGRARQPPRPGPWPPAAPSAWSKCCSAPPARWWSPG